MNTIMVRIVLCLLAAVIFFGLAFEVIDHDVLQWEWGGLGLLAVGVAPWPAR